MVHVTSLDRGGRSPAHYAALAGDVHALTEALNQGADPNLADKMGFTALHFAAQSGSVASIGVLLDAGAEIDPTNRFGNTPLHVAVLNSRGQGDVIAALSERGADRSLPNATGLSPVAMARRIANFDVGQYFVDDPD